MPHSSGGGSHSGGSSSGSSFSSGGGSHSGGSYSSGPSYITKKTAFDGSYRYVRYHDGKADCVYSTNPNLNIMDSGFRYLILLIYVPFIAVAFLSFKSSVHIPHKISTPYAENVAIYDDADVIDDEKQVRTELRRFYKQTGIPVVIYTTDNRWKAYYNNLTNYAYDIYVNQFEDEDHWLLVYTTDKNPEFEDWYWEGMQGDNTDNILSSSSVQEFNKNLHEYLLDNKCPVDKAFIQAFSELNSHIMDITINWPQIGISLVITIFLCGHMLAMFWGISGSKRKYKKYIKCPVRVDKETESIEIECEYCGGIYYKGTVTSCPHCGAPLRKCTEYMR